MIKKLILWVGVFLLSACNADNIPHSIPGTWKLEEIVISGRRDQSYTRDFVWKFQDNIIDILQVDTELHERSEHLGTWTLGIGRKTLFLDFTHSDNENAAGSDRYSIPPQLYLAGATVELEILTLNRRTMVLEWVDKDGGEDYRYEFIKF